MKQPSIFPALTIILATAVLMAGFVVAFSSGNIIIMSAVVVSLVGCIIVMFIVRNWYRNQ